MPVAIGILRLQTGLRAREQQRDQIDIFMRSGADGPWLGSGNRRIVQNAQQALITAFHHVTQRHGQAVCDAGRRLGLNPVQQFASQRFQIGIDATGHCLKRVRQLAAGIDMKKLLQILDW